MALITLPLYTLTFIFSVISVLGQDPTIRDLRCYNCESEGTAACEDPADVTVLQLMDCSSVAYHPPPREEDRRSLTEQALARPVDGKFRGGQVIEEVFEGNDAQRAQKIYKYVCLKVVLSADALKATTRTCAKVPTDVKEPCDFVKQEVDPKLKVENCYACDHDKCNSASLLAVSGIPIILSMFVIISKLIL